MRNRLLASILLCASSSVASANGFVINEHDAEDTGRGNATTASNTTASSIVYNVGGLAAADDTQVRVGGAVVMANGSFTQTGATTTTDTDGDPAVLPQLYVSSRVHEMIAVGVGVYAPFGLAISWPDDAPTNDVVHEVALRTVFITPAIGVNLERYVPGLTIGAGVDLVPASVELKQDIMFGSDRGTAHIAGTGFGVGGRVGVRYTPAALPQLSVGAMYRSKVKLDFDGTGDFDAPAPYRSQLPPDGDASTSLTLPQSVLGGIAYRPLTNLEVELDAVWMQWSSYDKLAITLPDGSVDSSPRDWNDETSIRVGVEYGLPRQHAAVRAGYDYDPSPVPADRLSAELPDADRHVISVGGSYDFSRMYSLHLGLLAVLPTSRDTSTADPYAPKYKGTYDISALVGSLTVAGTFGR